MKVVVLPVVLLIKRENHSIDTLVGQSSGFSCVTNPLRDEEITTSERNDFSMFLWRKFSEFTALLSSNANIYENPVFQSRIVKI